MATTITRRNRQTGTQITVGRSADLGLDPDGGWLTICEDHAFIVSHPTRKLAERHAADPLGWCEHCNGTAAADEPDDEPDADFPYEVRPHTWRGEVKGWQVVHIPTGRAFGADLYPTKDAAHDRLARLRERPEFWSVAYPARETFGGLGEVWETETVPTEADARAVAARRPSYSIERYVLDGPRYRRDVIEQR